VKNRGRKAAALVWWALAILAIVGNWTHTLGAVAQRGAGIEARSAKITADIEADRKTLARLERELGAIKFAATTPEAVSHAKGAAELAERNRKVVAPTTRRVASAARAANSRSRPNVMPWRRQFRTRPRQIARYSWPQKQRNSEEALQPLLRHRPATL